MGIRMALGATSRDILRLVVAEGMRPVLAGLIIGMVGAWRRPRSWDRLLFGLNATNPLTFVISGLLLSAIGLIACYLPAGRAARLDPILALRSE